MASWAQAWANREAEAVIALYSTQFVAPTDSAGANALARAASRAGRDGPGARLDGAGLKVEPDGADRRIVSFVQRFGANSLRKQLVLVRESGSWRIVEEKVDDVSEACRQASAPTQRSRSRNRDMRMSRSTCDRHEVANSPPCMPRRRCAPARCATRSSIDWSARSASPLTGATRRDVYDALTIAIREELAERWIATGTRVTRARVKRVCYLSMEFLLGRSLINALSSFEDGLLEEVRETARVARPRSRSHRRRRRRSRARQRRPRPARCLLPRFARDARLCRDRLRHSLRLRHLHAGHRRGRRAARSRELLARRAQLLGERTRRRALSRAFRRPLPGHARRAGPRPLRVGRHAGCLGRRLTTC